MSYDVDLITKTGPESSVVAYSINMTSNVAPVWRAAGLELKEFHERPVLDLTAAIDEALPTIMPNPKGFEQFVRGGGEWGTVDSCIHFLTMLKLHGEKHQYTTVRVCY